MQRVTNTEGEVVELLDLKDLHELVANVIKWIFGFGFTLVAGGAVWVATIQFRVVDNRGRLDQMDVNGPAFGRRLERRTDSLSYAVNTISHELIGISNSIEEVRKLIVRDK